MFIMNNKSEVLGQLCLLSKRKIIIFIFFITAFYISGLSQQVDDWNYIDENNEYYIYFESGSIIFFLPGSLSRNTNPYYIAGSGTYKVKPNIIKIRSNSSIEGRFLATKSTYRRITTTKDSVFSFNIMNQSDTSCKVPYANIYCKINKKKIFGCQSDKQGFGKIYMQEMPKDSSILIDVLGYQPLMIPLLNLTGGYYNVYLTPCELLFQSNLKKISIMYSTDTSGLILYNFPVGAKTKLFKIGSVP